MAGIIVVEQGGVGPGFTIQIHTDFIGDIPSGSHWTLQVLTADLERSALQNFELWEAPDQSCIAGVRTQQNGVAPGDSAIPEGTSCIVRGTLRDPTGQQLDSGDSIAVPWDTHSLQWFQQLLNDQFFAQAHAGGLTTEEHTWLDETQQSIQRTLSTIQGVALQTPIGALIAHPDIHILGFFAGEFTLSGRGRLSGHPTVGFAAFYGLLYQVTTVPSGFGQRDGAVIEWQQRMVQFAVIHGDRELTTEYVDEIQEFHQDNYLWVWQQYNPRGILYDVTPGVVLTCRWLSAS